MVHFNDVLGITASILIKSSRENLSDYLCSGELEKCSSTGAYILILTVLAHYEKSDEFSRSLGGVDGRGMPLDPLFS